MKDKVKDIMVSVITTTYNHEDYIAQCIESVNMQRTDFEIEHLIGEDDSNDSTRTICKKYESEFPKNIRLFQNDRKNVIYVGGQPTGRWNFNNLVNKAKGKYIAILPGDDYWTDSLKLQKQVSFLENNPEFSVCFHKFDSLQENKIIEGLDIDLQIIELKDWLNKGKRMIGTGTLTMVFKNDLTVIDDFGKNLNTAGGGDYPLKLLILATGKGFVMSESMAVYRIHESGISNFILRKPGIRFYQIKNFGRNSSVLNLEDKLMINKHILILALRNIRNYKVHNIRTLYDSFFEIFKFIPLQLYYYFKIRTSMQ